jgi:5-methylcytosine-specific restriction endonuclease McrA
MAQGEVRRLLDTGFWRRRRALQLREEPFCKMCADRGLTTPATTVDHVEPHRGDPNAFFLGPLQSLCTACHSRDKQRQENGAAAG